MIALKRIAILAEGATECSFIDRLMVDYFANYNLSLRSVDLKGKISVNHILKNMKDLYYSKYYVTTLVDYYGFKGKADKSVDELESYLKTEMCKSITNPNRHRFFPYIQKYEFEGLLFSKIESHAKLPFFTEVELEKLRSVKRLFKTPEDINDSAKSAPSKRIKKIKLAYNKITHGIEWARCLGLEAIRKECPRFNNWLIKLESLGSRDS